ncbi:hypothetical protein [Sulfurospirillum arsenophilum]|uniref:hypothetical protein n=1 Tax=Sulfurospirillum arsenophilum TaxID=56698 RepID=UPI0005A85725|nr:hypothetical protein [Sulfurospirillum arsenophilum]
MLSTLEILELEKKVFKYRLKKYLPYFILSALFFLLSIIGFIFYATSLHSVTSKENTSVPAMQNGTSPIENNLSTTPNTIVSTYVPLKEQNVTDETLLLQLPLIGKKSLEQKDSYLPEPTQSQVKVSTQEEELENRVLIRKTSKNDEESFYRTKEDKIDTSLLPPPLLEEQKSKGVIKIETQEVNSIKYLKERFEKSHNIIFALMLAEEYYISKNYQDSNKWSIIANTIDADNEKSWILFAKSKLKLGQKQDAISALEAYLKNNKSKVAQNLLTQIMSGESID